MATALEAPAEAETTHAAAPGSGLIRYILVRLVLIVPTVFILVTMVFVLMRLTGDPITAAQGGRLTPDQLAERIEAAGFNRPLIVQYIEYLGGILRGDFGVTFSKRPISEIIVQYGAATLELAIYAVIVALIIGIPLGLLAAYKRDKWQDAILRVSAILAYATPIFFVGLLLKLVFSVWLGWLPVSGRGSTRTELLMGGIDTPTGIYLLDAIRLGNGEAIVDVLRHAALPALALGMLTAGIFLRLVRTNVISTLGQQYVTSGRSRGVSEYRLVSKHAFRPALIPIITVMGMQIALLLGGAVLTETTFEWKGLGYMLTEFLKARDFMAVQGIVVVLAIIVAVTNFLVDVIAAIIDPRVRY